MIIKIISQDREHLTQGGARYYAKLLNPLFMERIHKIEVVEDGDRCDLLNIKVLPKWFLYLILSFYFCN